MDSHIDYLPGVSLAFDTGLGSFDVHPNSPNEITLSETLSDDSSSLIAEKLDTIIENEQNILYALVGVFSLALLVIIIRLLWTVFDKWFFGGV